jgi:nicotinamide-nucleotide adenylyltransferase
MPLKCHACPVGIDQDFNRHADLIIFHTSTGMSRMVRIAREELKTRLDQATSNSAPFTLLYSPAKWPLESNTSSPHSVPHIAVLDSSFNPPHLAHEAIASSSFPSHPPSTPATPDLTNSYTTRLLLFSLRNVDKSLKATDASLLQRFEMMTFLAERVELNTGQGVGIGLLNEPTFAGKAEIVQDWLKRERGIDNVQMSFLMGTDTLIRCFVPKYYPKGMRETMDPFFKSCYVVSAQRGEDETSRGVEEGVLEGQEVQDWVEQGRIRLSGSFKEGREAISSTSVRDAIQDGGSLGHLVSPEIEEYVRQEGLYTT